MLPLLGVEGIDGLGHGGALLVGLRRVDVRLQLLLAFGEIDGSKLFDLSVDAVALLLEHQHFKHVYSPSSFKRILCRHSAASLSRTARKSLSRAVISVSS